MTTIVEHVHFMIDFEGMTRHVRDLWAEGSYWKCIETLEALGIPSKYNEAVIAGRMKMVQDPEGVKGVNGQLAKDNWQPVLMDCHRQRYPSYELVAKIVAEHTGWAMRYLDEAYAEVCELWYEYEHYTRYNAKRMDEIITILKAYPEDLLVLAGVGMQTFRYEAEFLSDYNPVANKYEVDIEGFIAHEAELAERPKPKPDKTFAIPTGAIDPKGNFYTCGWMEHSWLVYEVAQLTIQQARKLGWITIAHPMDQPNHLIITYGDEEPTQRQRDTVADWKMVHTAADEISTGAGEWDTSFYDD